MSHSVPGLPVWVKGIVCILLCIVYYPRMVTLDCDLPRIECSLGGSIESVEIPFSAFGSLLRLAYICNTCNTVDHSVPGY